MTGENRRAVLPCQHPLGRGHRLGQRGQGFDGRHVQAAACNVHDLGPDRPVGEQPVYGWRCGLGRGCSGGVLERALAACSNHACEGHRFIGYPAEDPLTIHGESPFAWVGVGGDGTVRGGRHPSTPTLPDDSLGSVRGRAVAGFSTLECRRDPPRLVDKCRAGGSRLRAEENRKFCHRSTGPGCFRGTRRPDALRCRCNEDGRNSAISRRTSATILGTATSAIWKAT